MAFDISGALDWIEAPNNVTFIVQLNKVPDNITGESYNFTILMWTPQGYYPISSNTSVVEIPEGDYVSVALTVPPVQYGPITPGNNTSVNVGNFNVDIVSLARLKSAKVIIGDQEYQLTSENGGYYFYGSAIASKVKLPAGTYNYTVEVEFMNGETYRLPERTITIKAPIVHIISPEPTIYNTTEIPVVVNVTDTLPLLNVTANIGGKTITLTEVNGTYRGTLNLTSGSYDLIVKAVDEAGNIGTAKVHFVVVAKTPVEEVSIENRSIKIGAVSAEVSNVTVQNNTMIVEVKTKAGEVKVEVPITNNVPAVTVNGTAIEEVAEGEKNVTLVAGWNSKVENVEVQTEVVQRTGAQKLVSVKLRAKVDLEENGIAVIALRDINITKVRVIKEDGQVIYLTTDKSNPIGYYYKQGNIVFIVLKEDPIIEADGSKVVKVPEITIRRYFTFLNFLYYRYYNISMEEFNRVYEEAVKVGVDNTTLKEALELTEKAIKEYEIAEELAGGAIISRLWDISLLPHLRNAYIYLQQAIDMLKNAIKTQSV